jgi:hypothetical protein
MKRKLLKYVAIMLIMVGTTVACQKGDETETEPDSVGILPSSIEDVVDVFELKYGEIKEWKYNNQIFKFSITDIEDNLLNCAAFYGENPEFMNQIALQATLRFEMDKKVSMLKVSTSPCFWRFYDNDGTDIQSVWDLLASWPSVTEDYPSSFQWNFPQKFGKGILLPDSSTSIFIAKVHPCRMEYNYNVENNMYKLIFIITNNKTK